MIDKFTKNTSHPPNVDFGIVPDITGWVFSLARITSVQYTLESIEEPPYRVQIGLGTLVPVMLPN